MTRSATEKLYVNLSASQARKRLKRKGFGVRRVEAVDRNQSVIVHTATGAHFRELKSLFADVSPATTQSDLGDPIENLRNLGPATAQWLRDVGVHTRGDLEHLGPVLAYRLVRSRRNVSLNLLWSLVAALDARDWREVTEEEKAGYLRALEAD